MKINERRVRRTIEKFIDCLQYCYFHQLTKQEVVEFFGKKRAERWCGSWNGYPEMPLIDWYEKRYKRSWIFPGQNDDYYNFMRFKASKPRTYKNTK